MLTTRALISESGMRRCDRNCLLRSTKLTFSFINRPQIISKVSNQIISNKLADNGEKRYAKCQEHTWCAKEQQERVSCNSNENQFSLKILKDEQVKLSKFRETNGMKDAGLEVMRNTSSVGETKVVVQKWSNNVA